MAEVQAMTVSDLDVYAAANLLVKPHGAEASIQAAKNADAMLEKGDLDGKAVWLQILRAVKDLLHARPSGGEPIH